MATDETSHVLNSPTVGMRHTPMIAQLHSPINNMNRSMRISSSDKEGDKALAIQQVHVTVEDYIQVYHPDYNPQIPQAGVHAIESVSQYIDPDPISPQQHSQYQL